MKYLLGLLLILGLPSCSISCEREQNPKPVVDNKPNVGDCYSDDLHIYKVEAIGKYDVGLCKYGDWSKPCDPHHTMESFEEFSKKYTQCDCPEILFKKE